MSAISIETYRYVVREPGAVLREMQGLDLTINDTLRRVRNAPSRAMWYKVDQGQACLPKTARGIAQAIVQMEQIVHPSRPHRSWTDVVAKLFRPVNIPRDADDTGERG